ncbi:MAG: class I SAM-dependent methyltransferase [Flavobacteriaceae bacterium]|nr:class I SAM-dependent methyltransferase [Flavobacteriaceae bacterium]
MNSCWRSEFDTWHGLGRSLQKYPMIADYLRYKWKAVNAHGIHSPFVYELATKVLYDKQHFADYEKVTRLKWQMQQDLSPIHFTEYGAGKPGEHILPVGTIARRSAVNQKYGRLLFRLVRWFQPTTVIELGTSLGIGTAWLASGLGSEGHIHTFEGCVPVAEKATKNFEDLKLKEQIDIHVGPIENTLPLVLKDLPQIDFAYMDANHRLAPTLNYFNTLIEKAHSHTVFVLDDIYWSAEMKEAWRILKDDKRVSLSIDLHQFGLVFLLEDRAKEHFIVRF